MNSVNYEWIGQLIKSVLFLPKTQYFFIPECSVRQYIRPPYLLMKRTILLASLFLFWLSSCKQGTSMTDTTDFASELQQKIDSAMEGDVIELPDGKFTLTHPLLINGAKNITIRGKGKDATILTYVGRKGGAGAIDISTKGVVLESFTLNGTESGIKAENAKNVTLRDMKTNLLRTIKCSNILVEDCDLACISGAAIFIERSQNIIIRRNHLQHSITGCVIVNSLDADINDNLVEDNSIGILINTQPGCSKGSTARCRVFNNRIFHNNKGNNAAQDSTGLANASGIGLVILSASQCEVFNNDIAGQNATSIVILSEISLAIGEQDSLPPVYSNGIFIRDNKFKAGDGKPEAASPLAKLLAVAFGEKIPDIVYDGAVNPAYRNPDGTIKEDRKICIRNNNDGNASFGNMDIPGRGVNKSGDAKKFNCELPPLHEVHVN